jgi:TRAP-type C4-dicarboxylate transport system permease small subunit
VVCRRELARAWPVLAVLVALLLTQIVFLQYVNYRSLLNDAGTEVLFVGRYLLPMIALFGLAITFTVDSLPHRLGPPVAAVILGGGVLVTLTGIGLTAFRFYA